jgi:integrase
MRLELLDFKGREQRTLVLGSNGINAQSKFSISDGFNLYLRLKASSRPESFKTYTRRNQRYLIESLGDIQLEELSPIDGANFRDHLISKELSSASIRRVFSTIKAVVNLCISEHGLTTTNPFKGVYIPDVGIVNKRRPIPLEAIRKIQDECRGIDDDQRWLIALISDTGMRLAEGAGLLRSDFIEQDSILCVNIKPHPWRSLKTKRSARVIPLVGSAKWAAERILAQRASSQFAFANYNNGQRTNANSASATLNKWLKSKIGKEYTIHSFRHSIRDRLRAVECPSHVIDQIGGWLTHGVGHAYGTGYSTLALQKWLLMT